MSKLQKSSGSSDMFNLPDKPFSEHKPEMKKDIKRETREKDFSWKELGNQRPTRSNNSEGIENSRSSRILSAGMGTVSDNGGSKKQMGTETQNSIWDSEILSKRGKLKSNDEITKAEKEDSQKIRNGFKQERLDSMVEAIRNIDTRKSNSITSLSNREGTSESNKRPNSNISVFDKDSNFERLAEKTEGEKLAERNLNSRIEREEKRKEDRNSCLPQRYKTNLFN